jgi:hypothetical protein
VLNSECGGIANRGTDRTHREREKQRKIVRGQKKGNKKDELKWESQGRAAIWIGSAAEVTAKRIQIGTKAECGNTKVKCLVIQRRSIWACEQYGLERGSLWIHSVEGIICSHSNGDEN